MTLLVLLAEIFLLQGYPPEPTHTLAPSAHGSYIVHDVRAMRWRWHDLQELGRFD